MKKLKLRYSATILLLSFLSININSWGQKETQYTENLLKEGTKAPDFSLQTPRGKTIKLSNYSGKYIVLDFWASWCPDCRRDIPDVIKAYKQFKNKNVIFIGISFDTEKINWVNAIKKLDIKYLQVSELRKWKETNISKLYHVKWIPTLYLINKEGKVTFTTIHTTEMIRKLEEITNK